VAYPFIESPHINRTGGRKIDLIVVHTMEMDEKGETAENCAQWFRNPGAKVSAHYCVDSNSIVQCVKDENVAWAAPGANSDGIQIEHAGRAKQTGRDWSDPYSTEMLERSAALAAELCAKYKIPVTWLYAADLVAGKRGITSHDAVSKAFKRGSHWDPGTGFPIERYLGLIRKHLGTAAGEVAKSAPLKDDPPMLKRGAEGWQVTRLQKVLRQRGFFPDGAKIDGDFGEITETAVKAFQEMHDLEPDGVVGPMTWQALARADVTVQGGARALQPA